MKIAVAGIGGVGGYLGGKLARHYAGDKGVEIVFVARGKHLEEIRKNGLEVITPVQNRARRKRSRTRSACSGMRESMRSSGRIFRRWSLGQVPLHFSRSQRHGVSRQEFR